MNNNNQGPQNLPTRTSMRVVQPYKREYTTLSIVMGEVNALDRNGHNIRIYDNRLTPYLGDMLIGGTVIDQRCASNHKEFTKWAINGPTLKDSLPACTLEKLGENFPCYDARYAGVYNYVSLDIYLDLWRSLGARIGKRIGDNIVWEDGIFLPIPSVENRWQD